MCLQMKRIVQLLSNVSVLPFEMNSTLFSKNTCLLFLMTFLSHLSVWGTHNRAGEITYTHINGLTYEFTITTYTKESAPADRCELTIDFGDGSTATYNRENGPVGSCPFPAMMGEVLTGDFKKNIYRGQHTFSAPGIYVVHVEDQNRNSGVGNIPNSVNVPFYIRTTLRINGQLGPNNSVQLLNPPIDDGCTNKPFYHNPSAFDPDGDSLGYQLINCRGAAGIEILETYDPSIVSDKVRIDSVTGEVRWEVPKNVGQYNFALLVSEYRIGPLGSWEFMGSVTRDLQVDIDQCNNNPPVLDPLGPFCVVAGENINFLVRADDPDGDRISITGTGGPLVVSDPATFIQPITGIAPVTAFFSWDTKCVHVRKQPYTMHFKVKDAPILFNEPELVDFETVEIQVIAPAPKNPVATAQQGSIALSWDSSQCIQAAGYRLYRRNGAYGYVPDSCETDVPAYTGYQFLVDLPGYQNTSYLDDDSLALGNRYCYLVVAYFDDGSVSQASTEFCAALVQDAPVITKVDVLETDAQNGRIRIEWIPPRTIDSVLTPPGYAYALYRGVGLDPQQYDSIAWFPNYSDTVFTDLNLATDSNAYSYKVAFYYQATQGIAPVRGPFSNAAASHFLRLIPGDEQIRLKIEKQVPWYTDTFFVFRETSPGSAQFDSIGFSLAEDFVDSGRVNGETYCYKVLASGRYTGGLIFDPLLNHSQVACATAVDSSAPCTPEVDLTYDCSSSYLRIEWKDPPAECPEDIAYYNIYFKPSEDVPFPSTPLISNLTGSFFDAFDGDLIGCYAVSAVDDADGDPGGQANESPLSEVFCLEPCPVLDLPNVFTPNGDGENEAFSVVRDANGVPRALNISDFSMRVYNRWGGQVFASDDLDDFIANGWDGKDQSSGSDCSEGVYFYSCTYSVRSVRDQQRLNQNGFVHLFR